MREPKHSQWIPPSQREKENKTHKSKAMIRKPKVQWETRRRINNARFHRKDVRLIALEGDPLSSSLCISQNFLELPTVEKVMLSRDNEDPPGPSVCSLQRLSLGSLAETLLLLQYFFFHIFSIILEGKLNLNMGIDFRLMPSHNTYSSLCSRGNHDVTGNGRLTREIAPSALMV